MNFLGQIKIAANTAPSYEMLKRHYGSNIYSLLGKDKVVSKDVAKKPIVKDVPIVSSYGDVVNAAKAQDVGFITRHLVAALTRPSVWTGGNASFLARGKTGLVIAPEKINKTVIDHELGHAEDYARLGGEEGWKKEYSTPFLKALADPRGARIRRTLLPEARAWHYAGTPVVSDKTPPLAHRAFNSYVNHTQLNY